LIPILSREFQLRRGYVAESTGTDWLDFLIEPLLAGAWVGLILGFVFHRFIANPSPPRPY